MSLLTHTGDIGRAPIPSTGDVIDNHYHLCWAKHVAIEIEANRLLAYCGADSDAYKNTVAQAEYWLNQALLAGKAYNAIEREVWACRNSPYRGRSQR